MAPPALLSSPLSSESLCLACCITPLSIDRAASVWIYGDHKLNWMNSTSVGYIEVMISRLVVAAAD